MSGTGIKNEATQTRQRGLVIYLAVSLAVLIALAGPAAIAVGDAGPVLAWALTFVPGLAVVCQASRFGDPRQSLPFLFHSTMVRVVASLGGGLMMIWLFPSLPQTAFLLWLAGMYAIALAAEVYLTLSINSLWSFASRAPLAASSSRRWQEGGR